MNNESYRLTVLIDGEVVVGCSLNGKKPSDKEETIKMLEDILQFIKAPTEPITDL